ncbi:gamma-glutamyl-gamma-aminobutyrate hydrolase family protein [Amaricoccus macauensis]|uniref:gamma-glutamyl-gamma-aminobutyrate hydrolase family protein n=1 Tax=Amaricoccus macauensis TaxID=57001 RepID=UPI003C7C899A
MKRPVIGVTTSKRSGWRIFPLVAFNVWLAGGRAVRWVAGREADVSSVDGIIIGGGDDISPDLYKGEVVASARLDPARDKLEHDLVLDAMAQDKPVLGICRGSQMINVALGGTLYQDAYSEFIDSRKVKTILPKKTVVPTPTSNLTSIVGAEPMRVNSLHTQAVHDLGEGLRVSARDLGGMVQAIERVRDPFAIGVQWHPEHLFYARRQRALFAALVKAARVRELDESQVTASVAEA